MRKVGEVGMKKMLRMVTEIHLPMEDNETQEQAEDRAIELIENTGVGVYLHWNAEVVKVVDGPKRRQYERSRIKKILCFQKKGIRSDP